MRYAKKRCGLQVERLEKRDVPGTTQAVNPGNAVNAYHSGNIVGAWSAGVTGNGDLISRTEATVAPLDPGAPYHRHEMVEFYLIVSGRPVA